MWVKSPDGDTFTTIRVVMFAVWWQLSTRWTLGSGWKMKFTPDVALWCAGVAWTSRSSVPDIWSGSELSWGWVSSNLFSYFLIIFFQFGNNIPNSCPTQGRVEGWDAMKSLYWRSVSNKGAGRPRLSYHHRGWRNEMKLMRWVWGNDGMKCVLGEKWRNLEKNLSRPRFVHHQTHMEWPRRELGTPAMGEECLIACAMRSPPNSVILVIKH